MEFFTIFVARIYVIYAMSPRSFKIAFITIALVALTITVLRSRNSDDYAVVNSADYSVIQGSALGTFVEIRCPDTFSTDEIITMIQEVDNESKMSMSIFDPNSLLSRINRNETDQLDEHIIRNITLAHRFSELSEGAYDITVKPLTDAWGFGRSEEMVSNPNIDSLMEFVGYEKIAIVDGTIQREDYRTQIDLNSIAKGYTVDLMADRLEQMGIDDYLVNIGGEIRCKGHNAMGVDWSIGIETPYEGNMEMDSFEMIVQVSDCAVATSGNYRRFHTTDEGLKVVHTINPHTGYSLTSNLLSATVIAETCAEADAAATMFMAMGSEHGALALAERCEQEYGWSYYFIFADDNGGYRIECSEQFE